MTDKVITFQTGQIETERIALVKVKNEDGYSWNVVKFYESNHKMAVSVVHSSYELSNEIVEFAYLPEDENEG